MISEIPALFRFHQGVLRLFREDDDDADEYASACVLSPSLVLSWAAPPEPDNGSGWTFTYDLDGVGFTHSRSQAFRLLDGPTLQAAETFLLENHRDKLDAAAEGLARAMFGSSGDE